MKHIWTVLCQKSAIDIETNLLSLFNCVEELEIVVDGSKASQNGILIPAEFQLASFWTAEDAAEDCLLETQIAIVDPKGKVLNSFENKHEIKKGVLRFRNRLNIQGLPVTEAGRYHFRISHKQEGGEYSIVVEIPLDVRISYEIMDMPKKS